ncbi:MAG: methylmalonyl-CoA mutase [Streptosporangiaceae bacterium]|jgi:methylaspartate mutase sigma subunit
MMLTQHGRRVLIAGGASDSHTWNLIYLQLLVEESGHRVINFGPCATAALLARECRPHPPSLVVISSVNGHGYRDGLSVISGLRADPALTGTPIVIGGKLGVDGRLDEAAADRLIDAGFTAVFGDGDTEPFLDLLTSLTGPAQTRRSRKRVP